MPRGRRALTNQDSPQTQPVPSAQSEPAGNGEAAAFQLPACITERQLKALLRSDEEFKGQIDSLNGELRSAIGEATERQHLHKGAYSILKKIRKCRTAEQKALLFYTLLEYVRLSGELRIVEAVPALPLPGESVPTNNVVEMPRRPYTDVVYLARKAPPKA